MSRLQIDILTLFPEFFESLLQVSLLGKAIREEKIGVALHNFRKFATDKHHTVDDMPYGGGAGMVLKPEPLIMALESLPKKPKSRTVLLTPRGHLLTQEKLKDWAGLDQLILIAGRYEGVDERVATLAVDEEISIGDYVVNGGEVAAAVILEGVSRLVPGVLGNPDSLAQESHGEGWLEYPQYTRPPEFRGLKVPEILLSGDHLKIGTWRREQQEALTLARREDLLKRRDKILAKGGKKD